MDSANINNASAEVDYCGTTFNNVFELVFAVCLSENSDHDVDGHIDRLWRDPETRTWLEALMYNDPSRKRYGNNIVKPISNRTLEVDQ